MKTTKYTTVVIPAFNHKSLLKRCLDSLVAQSMKNFDVVLVDDGSKPKLRNIYLDYIDILNIKYFYIENTGYPSEPRNYGTQYIDTPFISFLDSDDFFHPKLIEILYKNIESYRGRIDLIHTYSYNFLEEKSIIISINKNRYKKYNLFEMVREGNKIVLSSVTMDLRSFQKIGKFKKIRWEDFNLYLSMSKKSMNFKSIKIPLVYHSISDRYKNKKNRMNKGFLFTNKRIRKKEGMVMPIWSISYLLKNSSTLKYRFKLVLILLIKSIATYRYGVFKYKKIFLIILFSLNYSIKKFIRKTKIFLLN